MKKYIRLKGKSAMNKKIFLIGGIIILSIVLFLFIGKAMGLELFSTLSGVTSGEPLSYSDVNDLKSGKAYVWHHDGGDIKKDLKGDAGKDVYFTCITGDINFKNHETEEEVNYPRSIWVSPKDDKNIPTMTSYDKLIYVSSTEVPEEIIFERFADYGYTIGVSNLMEDGGGHYYIKFSDADNDDYKYFIDMNSDAKVLSELQSITKLYLDQAGDVKVNEDSVSDGGTVDGLPKDKTITCEFYTGTYYQDFNLTADIHSFGSMERFISHDYEFMHSNFIVIDIPEYLKSGYYFVNGVGLFRYVSDQDKASYKGKAYDPGIDWNDPIILYNEDGTVKYDPSDPDFEEKKKKEVEENSDPGIEEIETKESEVMKDESD